jgi:hypothetical protein
MVEGHAEELHARHAASDGRISDAAAGVPAASTAALGAAVTKWQLDTTVLHGRLTGHGQALSGAASTFVGTEERNAADINAVGVQAPGTAASDL